VLGTAQFGLDYGVTNKAGMPSLDAMGGILRQAADLGIATLDTARAYGESERRIGILARSWCAPESASEQGSKFPFQVMTKLDPLSAEDFSDTKTLGYSVRRSLERSAEELGEDAAPKCVLLHRPGQRTAASGLVWEELKAWRAAVNGRTIGISLSSPAELEECLVDMNVNHVQLPYNCLDYRWESEVVQKALAIRKDVTVHVRSVLLQGLLATNDEADLLKVLDRAQARRVSEFMNLVQVAANAASRVEAAISFVSSVDWISGMVIGVASQRELREVTAAFSLKVDPKVIEMLRGERPILEEAVLNPAMWRKS
jgi:spore coat polysaccharide biosynthesis protein SpsF